MEPNKLEKEIREKLGKREIQPGEMAWDRLDAMLTVSEKKKPKRRAWMYLAASFLGLLLAGTLFLKQAENNDSIIIKDSNNVVTAPKVQEENKDKSNITTIPPQAVKEAKLPVIKNEAVAVKAANKPQIKKMRALQADKNKITAPILQKQEVAANNEKQEVKISPAYEAEMLLASTMENTQQINDKPTVNVDPNSLLNEVEGELNESFRSKVWQTVTKNYNVVKTSVVNRNIE